MGVYLFRDGSPYHIETSLLIWFANQWTGLYIIGTSIMIELKPFETIFKCDSSTLFGFIYSM